MADSNTTMASAIRTGLIGLVVLAVLAVIYGITDWLDPTASPYTHTIITGTIAVVLLGAGWLASRAWKTYRAQRAKQSVPKATGDRLSIVVAALKDDEDGKIANRVVLSLREELGTRVEVIPVNEIILAGTHGNTDIRALEARKMGQDLLARTQTDVLVWGEAFADKNVVDLNFLAREIAHSSTTRSYALNQTMRLPFEFERDLGTALSAAAAAAAAPAIRDAGRYLVPVLRPIAERLRHLVERPPLSLDRNNHAGLLHAYAIANRTMGDQTGDSEYIERAISAYRDALEICTRDRSPLSWAMTQNNLGVALVSIGEREAGTLRLEEAVVAYREGMTECTHERAPLDWAMMQDNLGIALTIIDEREGGTARLQEAATAFREALKERTREHTPIEWAKTQNNLANTLTTLGEREDGTAKLEQAVAAYRNASMELTRELVPLDWATAQNNMGTALTTLGERESGTAKLRQAVSAYREALKERSREHVPLQWAATQSNLAGALLKLGGRENGTKELEAAVIATQAALEVFETFQAPHFSRATRNNLALAEAALAARRAEIAAQHQP